ncbi:homeodomain-like protein [Rhizophagus clarus]|uniref:Homeodomain-like protein n=1 Tax=Rhizophagus clarus TaxID=94130 RepID=A0A8H3R6M9_9GLOM|nr:homeodomain-like protein [Rhizophagus clarus]
MTRAFSEDLKWRIVFLYYNGHNCKKIAELLYISKTTVKKVLQIYMRWGAVILQELVKDKIDWYLDELVGELEVRIVGCEYKPEQFIFMDKTSKDERTLSRGYGYYCSRYNGRQLYKGKI